MAGRTSGLTAPSGVSDRKLKKQTDREETRAARSERKLATAERKAAKDIGTSQGGAKGTMGRTPGAMQTGGSLAPPLAETESIRPRSGFGQQYVGSMYGDLYENPEVLAGDFMKGIGVDPQGGSGMWKTYSDLAQVMPQLFLLTQGGGTPEGGSLASFLDYANQFLTQYSTPGAGTISPNAIGSIFSAGADTPLGQMLSDPNATPAQLANMVLSLIGSGLATSMPGPFARGISGHAEAAAQEWLAEQARGGKGSFTDMLKSRNFDEMFR